MKLSYYACSVILNLYVRILFMEDNSERKCVGDQGPDPRQSFIMTIKDNINTARQTELMA